MNKVFKILVGFIFCFSLFIFFNFNVSAAELVNYPPASVFSSASSNVIFSDNRGIEEGTPVFPCDVFFNGNDVNVISVGSSGMAGYQTVELELTFSIIDPIQSDSSFDCEFDLLANSINGYANLNAGSNTTRVYLLHDNGHYVDVGTSVWVPATSSFPAHYHISCHSVSVFLQGYTGSFEYLTCYLSLNASGSSSSGSRDRARQYVFFGGVVGWSAPGAVGSISSEIGRQGALTRQNIDDNTDKITSGYDKPDQPDNNFSDLESAESQLSSFSSGNDSYFSDSNDNFSFLTSTEDFANSALALSSILDSFTNFEFFNVFFTIAIPLGLLALILGLGFYAVNRFSRNRKG